jgi:hypothetical protein
MLTPCQSILSSPLPYEEVCTLRDKHEFLHSKWIAQGLYSRLSPFIAWFRNGYSWKGPLQTSCTLSEHGWKFSTMTCPCPGHRMTKATAWCHQARVARPAAGLWIALVTVIRCAVRPLVRPIGCATWVLVMFAKLGQLGKVAVARLQLGGMPITKTRRAEHRVLEAPLKAKEYRICLRRAF